MDRRGRGAAVLAKSKRAFAQLGSRRTRGMGCKGKCCPPLQEIKPTDLSLRADRHRSWAETAYPITQKP